MKRCPKCKNEKPFSEFYKNISKKSGLDGFCKICRGIATTEYYYRNHKKCKAQGRKRTYKYRQEHKEELKEKSKEYYRKHYSLNPDVYKGYRLKRNYGITLEDYNKLYERQQGCCFICGIHQSKLKKSLGIDHCHKSGKIRSLLCINCNRALGMVQEDIRILQSMIKYLQDN